jgi:hypothetical protein
VIKYVQGGSSADRFGFGEEEGGYVAEQTTTPTFDSGLVDIAEPTVEPTVRAETTIPLNLLMIYLTLLINGQRGRLCLKNIVQSF